MDAGVTGDAVRLHPEGFSRAPTTFERAGYAIERWLVRLGLGIVILAIVTAGIVAIPLARIVGSDEHETARRFVLASEDVAQAIGPVLSVSRPRRYRRGGGHATLAFDVQGYLADGQVEVVVEEVERSPDARPRFRVVGGFVKPRVGAVRPFAPRRGR